MKYYYLLNMTGMAMVFLYNLLHIKQKREILGSVARKLHSRYADASSGGIKKLLAKEDFWVVLEILLITGFQYVSSGVLNTWFGDLVGTGANYFGLVLFAPLLVVAVCLLLRIDPLKQMDLITPAYPLALIFVKFACFSARCCQGMECSFGFYWPERDLVEFPSQLLEAAVALMLFILLLRIKDKMATGTLFPFYLTVYSAVRFFTEFTRWEQPVFGVFKRYHLLCLLGILVGFIEYFVVYEFYQSQLRKKEKTKKSKKTG